MTYGISSNPLRQPKYDARLFHQWNFEVRRSIRAYDSEHAKQYPPELLYYGYTAFRTQSGKTCAVEGCDTKLKHLRSRLCEAHRVASRAATKHGRKPDGSAHVPAVPGVVPDGD